MFSIQNRDTLQSNVGDEFDRLTTRLTSFVRNEHTESGTHDLRAHGFDSVPVGTISMWPLSVSPDSWLMCNGSIIKRDTYSQLFGILGETFGAGDGATTFQLPNLAPAGGIHFMILACVGRRR